MSEIPDSKTEPRTKPSTESEPAEGLLGARSDYIFMSSGDVEVRGRQVMITNKYFLEFAQRALAGEFDILVTYQLRDRKARRGPYLNPYFANPPDSQKRRGEAPGVPDRGASPVVPEARPEEQGAEDSSTGAGAEARPSVSGASPIEGRAVEIDATTPDGKRIVVRSGGERPLARVPHPEVIVADDLSITIEQPDTIVVTLPSTKGGSDPPELVTICG